MDLATRVACYFTSLDRYKEFFNTYSTYDAYITELSSLDVALYLPKESTERRAIPVAKVGKGRTSIMVTGLLHATEFISGEVTMGVLRNVLRDEELLDKATFYFLPVLNPDGVVRNEERVKQTLVGTLKRSNVNGVDLNRNFADNFEGRAWTNKIKNTTEYAGTHAFSERESRFVRDFVDYANISGAVNLHSAYGAILYPPWSSEKCDVSMMALAHGMQEEMLDPYVAVPGSKFVEYVVNDLLFKPLGRLATMIRHPTVEGTLDGWLYKQGIPSMLMEVSRPNKFLSLFSQLALFNPFPSTVQAHVDNCYPAIRRYIEAVC